MVVDIDNFLTDPEVELGKIYNHRGTQTLKPVRAKLRNRFWDCRESERRVRLVDNREQSDL